MHRNKAVQEKRGMQMSDVIAMLGSLDFVVGEVDR